MKQNDSVIKLLELTNDDHVFGNEDGRDVFLKLKQIVDKHPESDVFGISLEGIVATDASFPRESIVSLAKQYRGEKGFYLTDFISKDLVDNWNYAAQAKEQPLIIWHTNSHEIIGPSITPSTRELVEYVIKQGDVTTSKVAEALNISVQNASTKLKNLVKQGYILRTEEVAGTGGVEYIYRSIH